MLSVESILQVEEQARAKAAGSAQRVGTVAPVMRKAATVEDTPEDEATKLARNKQIMSRIMEYGVSQLPSMRACMAKCVWKSTKARLAWRATPSRDMRDKSKEGLGTHALDRIK